ncbi:MAG TPA: RNA polymerase sigma factor [Anaerolineae bacterium]|nr:RNA polymerase sigma factor [Anaerolineae bacterium]
MQPAITDEQILALLPRCQTADQAAVEAVYQLYGDRLYRYLLARTGDADTAADLSIELFVRMIQHIGGFRLDRRRPAASFSGWLYRIAANLLTDHYRSRSRSPVALSDELPAPGRATDPQRLAEQHEVAADLSAALSQLSEEQRLVIIGKFAEEMSNAEIAAWLGKSEGAVKSLQHRALRTLGRLLASPKPLT